MALSIYSKDSVIRNWNRTLDEHHEAPVMAPVAAFGVQPHDDFDRMLPPSSIATNGPGRSESPSSAELNTTASEAPKPKESNQRLSARQSLGFAGCMVIFGGSVLVLPFLGFLLFLWGGAGSASGGAQATTFWRIIMLNGWALQLVTLSSLVLRAITAAQAAMCASLLAGLIAERQNSPITTIAKLSVLRAVNVNPLHLLRTMRTHKTKSITLWPGQELALAAIIALFSLAIQFSSTVLISDFDTVVLTRFPMKTRQNVALSESTLNVSFIGSYQALRDEWPTFGGQGTLNLAKPSVQGLSDTGLQQRAFLPYDKNNRTTLRTFKGPTAVMATRVSCIPPILDATFSPIYPDSTYPYGAINGSILFDRTFDGVNLSATSCSYDAVHNKTACLPSKFKCTVSNGLISDSDWSTEWVPSLCHLVIPEIESTVPDEPPTEFHKIEDIISASAGRWNRDVDPWNEAAYWPFLVIATNAQIDLLKTMNETGTLMLPLQSYHRYGEWSSFNLTESSLINVTLCSAGFNMSLAHVELSSIDDPREPSVVLNATTLMLDGENVQILLGGSDIQDPRERGILSLDKIEYLNSTLSISELDPFQPEMGTESFGSFLFYNSLILWKRLGILVRGWNDGTSVGVCTPCWSWTYTASRDVAVLFTRIINTSGRAAVAVDTLLYGIMSTWYYDLLPGSNVPGIVEVSFSKSCNVPRYWRGIIAVIGLIGLHLICVLTITIRYLRLIRYSRQGDIWHTVSQLVSTPTNHILEIGNNSGDKQIAEAILGEETSVKIGPTGSGRIGVIAGHG